MPRFENPIVLATRPRAFSEAFLTALQGKAGAFRGLIAPAFECASTGAPIPPFDVAIFTSRAGVAMAPGGAGRHAFCVGDATAQAAEARGYRAVSASGSAVDLIPLILDQAPNGRLLHVRGETAAAEAARILTEAGLPASEVIAYRKEPCPPDAAALAALQDEEALILPLFSAETVSILAEWPCSFQRCHAVAISDTVADAAAQLSPAGIAVSDSMTQEGTIRAVARLIA
ncbi:uroporphyrinogen-III synthase [Thalassorhabdomicrobium marinisediminis]|uniref:uroporphyrinogen-III synthase n=1 Tax=Thalassorhabdomicrobium marinisediminis TaxID=2170577 RepID=UPI0024917C6D|nr:uroporphyrinogen-III synthase [Thalassorhabdomicrobium marinisediminis]